MGILVVLLLSLCLHLWSEAVTGMLASSRDQYFIEKNISFTLFDGRQLPLVFRIHMVEEPVASVDRFIYYYDLHAASGESLHAYVQQYIRPMQAIQSAMWTGATGQLYLYNIHTDDLSVSVDRHCRGLMLRDGMELARCITDITADITVQCSILIADFETNRIISKQIMGVWENVRGITVINPPSWSVPLYWGLPSRPEPVLILPEELSLHVVIATTGISNRIFGMIASLQELSSHDYLTILFDGADQAILINDILEYAVLLLECTVLHRIEPIALGFWGHAIRNTLADLPGHFVWHIDDDDIVLPGALISIRVHCTDANSLYLFRMRNNNISAAVWTEKNVIRYGGIGTPNGLIPASFNKLAKWGLYYGGDYDFYASLVPFVRDVVFVDQCIYRYFKL